jgi:DNA-binding transcriptional LysR family regulator
MQIRQLEDAFGVPLIEPVGRNNGLSHAGEAFQTYAIAATRAAMERLFAEHQTPLNVEMEMPSNETIKQAVMAGMGLSFLSLRTVRHELASGHMALVDIEGLPSVGNWYVTHMSHKKLSPAARAFKEFLTEQGGALMDSWS